jgi:hypothetical protein
MLPVDAGDLAGCAFLFDDLVSVPVVDDRLRVKLLVPGDDQEPGRVLANLGVELERHLDVWVPFIRNGEACFRAMLSPPPACGS